MSISQQRFVTNGTLLQKNWNVFSHYASMAISFKITQHVSTPALQDAIDWIFHTFDWEQVTEFGITRWRERGTDFPSQITKPKHL